MGKGIVLFLSLMMLGSGSVVSASADTMTVEQLRADFDDLYRRLESAHFDLFANTPKSRYDRYFDDFRAQLNTPMTLTEAAVFMQRFVALGDIAHAKIDLPYADFRAFREKGGRTFPVALRFHDGAYRISENYSTNKALQYGDRVTSLNGLAIDALESQLGLYLSADTPYMLQGFIEQQLKFLLWLEYGELDSFELCVAGESESPDCHRLAARSREEMQLAESTLPPLLNLDWQRQARVLDGGVAYLRPGPFFNFEGGEDKLWDSEDFAAFIQHSFADFAAAKAKVLLIDVRNNPGGDNSFSDLIVARLAKQAFRFASSFRVKVSAESMAANAERLASRGGASGISAKYAKIYAQNTPGDVIEFPLPYVQPYVQPDSQTDPGTRFDMPVYVLVNRYSYSNAVTFAAMIQDYGLGKIIGEETSDLATTYGAMESFRLPHSGIKVSYPKALIIRPNGDQSSRGVVPDLPLDVPLMQGADDPVLAEAVSQLRRHLQDGV